MGQSIPHTVGHTIPGVVSNGLGLFLESFILSRQKVTWRLSLAVGQSIPHTVGHTIPGVVSNGLGLFLESFILSRQKVTCRLSLAMGLTVAVGLSS